MGKGERTKDALVDQALDVAAHEGLESLSFGELARQMGMSKTGVFGPFKSLTNLKLAVLDRYGKRFKSQRRHATMLKPEGLPSLRALFLFSVEYILDSPLAGSFLISCAAEYDDRPGPLRDEVIKGMREWRGELESCANAAIKQGQLEAHTDAKQLAFELFSVILGVQHDARLLHGRNCLEKARRAYDNIVRPRHARREAVELHSAAGSLDFMHGAVCLIDCAAKGRIQGSFTSALTAC